MSLDLRYYLAIFLRRLPWFILLTGLISGLAIFVAIKLPPAYVSQTRLIIENSQIPDNMAAPTVDTPAVEQLQLFETRLLTRDNLLAIARKLNVLQDQGAMNSDEIVDGMRARTTIRRQSGRDLAALMTISFEARSGQIAAGVLNEYLTLILQQDAANRTQRAGQTQDFFKQEVSRLSEGLDAQGAKMLAFKTQNADALPDSLDFRRSEQSALQDRVAQADREIGSQREQRAQLVQIFAATGRIGSSGGKDTRSPDQIELDRARKDLSTALLVYSSANPRVKLLQDRIAQLEKSVVAAAGTADDTASADPGKAMLDVQLAQIDSRVTSLETQKTSDQDKLDVLTDSIARTPANAIAIDAMQRDYDNLQAQYNQAVGRLAQASTGERIELLSRGQRVSVIEQPSVPAEPTKPNRRKLALFGIVGGLASGFGLVVLLEILNGTARRPADLIARLGITPIATIPYLRTRREVLTHRLSQIAVVLLIVVAIPSALAAVHYFYMPLDLIADRLMSRFGVRG